MVVFRFHPKSGVDRVPNGRNYVKVFKLLHDKGRYGVLQKHSPLVKDCYMVPVAKSERIPAQLLPFCGPGLEEDRQDLLLGVMWRKCRDRTDKHVRRWTRVSKRPRASMSPIDIDSTVKPRNASPPPVVHPVHHHHHRPHHAHQHHQRPHGHHHQQHHHARPTRSSNPDDDEPYDPAEELDTEKCKISYECCNFVKGEKG